MPSTFTKWKIDVVVDVVTFKDIYREIVISYIREIIAINTHRYHTSASITTPTTPATTTTTTTTVRYVYVYEFRVYESKSCDGKDTQ